MAVQSACNQLFAGARFAIDQHCRVRLRQSANGAEYFLHRRSLAENIGCHLNIFGFGGLAFALFQRALYQLHRVIDVERLGQIFKCTSLKCRNGTLQIGIGGHDDDRNERMPLMQRLQKIQPGTARHTDIADDHLWHVVAQCPQGVVRRGKTFELYIFARQRFFQHPAYRTVVINNPDWFHNIHQIIRGGEAAR